MIETISGFAVVIFLTWAALTIAAIIMPLVVLSINSKSKDIARTLHKMEYMMRNGK